MLQRKVLLFLAGAGVLLYWFQSVQKSQNLDTPIKKVSLSVLNSQPPFVSSALSEPAEFPVSDWKTKWSALGRSTPSYGLVGSQMGLANDAIEKCKPSDIPELLEFMRLHSGDSLFSSILHSAMLKGIQDRNTMLQWINGSLPKDRLHQCIFTAYGRALAQVDQSLSLNVLSKISDPRAKEWAVEGIALGLPSDHNVDVVAQWDNLFTTAPSEKLSGSLSYEAGSHGSGLDLYTRFYSGKTKIPRTPQTVSSLLRGMADRDAREMASFIESSKFNATDSVLASKILADSWYSKDPRALSEWLANSQASPARDAGRSKLAELLTAESPVTAGEWVKGIQDLALKKSSAQALYESWSKADQGSAKAWMNQFSSSNP